MSTRETQFAGFAALLGAEIADTDGWNLEAVEKLIARRAYDFAYHVMSETTQAMAAYNEGGEVSRRENIRYIPDLTAWPEPSEDSPDALQHYTCAVCSKTYTGTLRNIQGWYGYQDASGAKPETFAFCSEVHMNQWKTEHDNG